MIFPRREPWFWCALGLLLALPRLLTTKADLVQQCGRQAIRSLFPIVAALLELRVGPRRASQTAGSGRGPRYLARAKALSVGLSNAYFKSLGLPSLVEEC